MANWPFFTSTNSILSPVSRPNAVRTCAGIVICPFEVMVAAGIVFLSEVAIPYFIVRSRKKVFKWAPPHSLALGARHYSYLNSRNLLVRVVKALGCFHEVRRLRVGNVNEGLRVAIGEREPGTLQLHHDAMAAPERMINILHGEVNLLHLAGSKRLRFFEAVAELGAEGLAPHQLLVSAHGEFRRENVFPR